MGFPTASARRGYTKKDTMTVTPEMFLRAVHRTGAVYVHNPALAALGLCTELGEFAAKPSVDEAGDVLWHVALLCEQTGLVDWADLCARLQLSSAYRAEAHPLQRVVALLGQLDHLKKLIAGSSRVDERVIAQGLCGAAAFVTSVFPVQRWSVEDAMRANIIKIAKRDPRALPAEVLELLKEAGQ